MKFLAITYGSEGDTRPIAALCRALMNAGHEAHLLGEGAMLAKAEASGVPASPLAGDIIEAFGRGKALVRGTANLNQAAKMLAALATRHTGDWLEQAIEAGVGCDAVLVSGLGAFVGLSAADYLGVPVIGAGLIPFTPTREFLNPLVPPKSYPQCLNRLSFTLLNELMWLYFRRSINAARLKTGKLRTLPLWWDEARHKGDLLLYGISPTLLPRPADWPANAAFTGAWTLKPEAWEPPRALAEFLSAGEAPIYVGFGSMSIFSSKELWQALIEAVGNRRALIYGGESSVETMPLLPNCFKLGPTPHHWLLPRVSLAVHHGGCGTTHAAALAGVPSVVLPFAADQFFWAERLAALGIAPKPKAALKVRADELKSMLDFAQRGEVRTRARAIGEQMACEDGTRTAVERIEAALRRSFAL